MNYLINCDPLEVIFLARATTSTASDPQRRILLMPGKFHRQQLLT
jgi:hypothetical protein